MHFVLKNLEVTDTPPLPQNKQTKTLKLQIWGWKNGSGVNSV